MDVISILARPLLCKDVSGRANMSVQRVPAVAAPAFMLDSQIPRRCFLVNVYYIEHAGRIIISKLVVEDPLAKIPSGLEEGKFASVKNSTEEQVAKLLRKSAART